MISRGLREDVKVSKEKGTEEVRQSTFLLVYWLLETFWKKHSKLSLKSTWKNSKVFNKRSKKSPKTKRAKTTLLSSREPEKRFNYFSKEKNLNVLRSFLELMRTHTRKGLTWGIQWTFSTNGKRNLSQKCKMRLQCTVMLKPLKEN